MKRWIKLQNQKIEYTLKISSRTRHLHLIIYGDGSFVVSAPRYLSSKFIKRFITQKSSWIIKKLAPFKTKAPVLSAVEQKQKYLKYKETARLLIQQRITHFNKFYNFKFGRISVRNQKTRWGSCSKAGNLNFNYKLALLPVRQVDYIIVHELCHLQELNHSPRFWALLKQTIPDYIEIKKELLTGSDRELISK